MRSLRLVVPILAALALAAGAQEPAAGDAAPSVPGGGAPAADEVLLLCLRDGRTLWGSIEAHDEEGLDARRLANGGRVRLPWQLLDPAQGRALQLLLGYVGEEQDEILLDADRIVLHDGTELVGRIVERADGHLWVARAGGTLAIPEARVATAGLTRAPALELYDRAELYQRFAAEHAGELVQPGEAGARAHVELARTCERILAYERASEHWAVARELAPDYLSQEVAQGLERSGAKALRQEQVDLLAEADQWRGRGQYERAWAILDAFPERFPDTPLLEDWNRLRRRVERSQERELRETVVARVHHWAARLARDAGRAIEGWEAARSWAEDAFESELFTAVHADLLAIAPAITVAETRRLWEEREGGRWRQASYGLGTWLLGEERALATGEEPADEAPAEGTQEDARKRLEERIKRYLETQEVVRRNRQKSGTDEDPEAFWRGFGSNARSHWLLAYFVESSAVFRTDDPRLANCRECGGTGVRLIAFTGGAISGQTAGTAKIECPTCHGLGRVRRVRYR